MDKNIYLVMNCPVSPKSMGGGDRILIEYGKVWNSSGYDLTLLACEEGSAMCQANNLPADYIIISRFPVRVFGMIGAYLMRIFKTVLTNIRVDDEGLLYSASDFLPDTVPAFKAKLSHKYLKWVVGFYLRARNPFSGEVTLNARNSFYFLQQQLSLFLMRFAQVDGVFVLSEEDTDYLVSKGFPPQRIFLTSGGVDLKMIENVASGVAEFDACFVGKFQDQKGIPELVETWKQVLRKRPRAKLAIIGWGIGHWADFLRSSIVANGWDQSVHLFGFLDGQDKFSVLKKSKVFVFPSTYESWGIVTIEAMAAGLPVVAFDLPALKRNLTQGVVFSSLGDVRGLAASVLELLEDERLYQKKKDEAEVLSRNYDWEEVGLRALNFLRCLG